MMSAHSSQAQHARVVARRSFDGFGGKVFRDPVYGNISVTHPAVLEIIDSPEFQRLRRIHQLGMCHTVYYGAEHSRFQHSIGAMWLMHRIVQHWRERRVTDISDELETAATLAALLHDIGHGPFSHALETVFSHVHHEAIGNRVIRDLLRPRLERHNIDVNLVLGIMQGTAGLPYLSELISSQVDVDRMDYLLRDSLYTGVRYGLFDIDRMVYTLIPIAEPSGRMVLAFDAKGIHAAEEYIFSRYSMYWQVYFHKTTRSCEVLLKAVLQRAHDLAEQGGDLYLPPNLRFIYQSHDGVAQAAWLEAFLAIDDTDLYHAIKQWRNSGDTVLSDLANRFINRLLFKALPAPHDDALLEDLRALVEREYGADARYYFHVDRPADSAYDYYTAEAGKPAIRVVTRPPDGWEEISAVTQTQAVRALGQVVSRAYVLLPDSCAAAARSMLKGRSA